MSFSIDGRPAGKSVKAAQAEACPPRAPLVGAAKRGWGPVLAFPRSLVEGKLRAYSCCRPARCTVVLMARRWRRRRVVSSTPVSSASSAQVAPSARS